MARAESRARTVDARLRLGLVVATVAGVVGALAAAMALAHRGGVMTAEGQPDALPGVDGTTAAYWGGAAISIAAEALVCLATSVAAGLLAVAVSAAGADLATLGLVALALGMARLVLLLVVYAAHAHLWYMELSVGVLWPVPLAALTQLVALLVACSAPFRSRPRGRSASGQDLVVASRDEPPRATP